MVSTPLTPGIAARFHGGPKWYDVDLEGGVKRIHRVGVGRAAPMPDPTVAAEPLSEGIIGLVWRAFVGALARLAPDDPPRIIAIIKAPERMYCARCGTQRVSRYCPICGANVEKQYRKMVLQMAQYVVNGTSERRESLEQAVMLEVERRVADLKREYAVMLSDRLQQVERELAWEIETFRTAARKLVADRQAALPSPEFESQDCLWPDPSDSEDYQEKELL
jgi:hypothetical protein